MFCFFCKQKTAYEMRISDWSSDVCSSDRRGDRSIKVAVARDHQHRDRRIASFDLVEQVEPVQPRALEPVVEQDQRRAPRRDRLERGIAVRRAARLRSAGLMSEPQAIMSNSYAVFCMKKKNRNTKNNTHAPKPNTNC